MIDQIGTTGGVGSTAPLNVTPAKTRGQDGDFASMLSGLLEGTVDAVKSGEKASIDGLSGKIPLHEVVDKVMTAEQSFQTAIAVRDKIVSAYLEVSRMNI
ncbi:MAG: flagellar hook-basal body complex protein FliE [Proteobacteria bacterium]|nr:flagellar hook-basal body complex protein FliE [Pseudomonadota bacterium]